MNRVLITLSLFFAAAFANGVYHGNTMDRRYTFLVSMSNSELREATRCVAEVGDIPICVQITDCLSLLPPRILTIYKGCRQPIMGVSWPQCFPTTALMPAPLQPRLFDCMSDRTRMVAPQEEMNVVQFETCLRDLYAGRCMRRPGRYGLY